MKKGKERSLIYRLLAFFAYLGVLTSTVSLMLSSIMTVSAAENATVVTTQEGCSIKIETKEEVDWKMPRTPIDFVLIQDNSGSFESTISTVQRMLVDITEPVAWENYNPNDPKLVFTGEPETTDRVMITTYRGIDRSDYYSDNRYRSYYSYANVLGAKYTRTATGLLSSKVQIDNAINSFTTGGGTPTVPAIDDTIRDYNAIKNTGLGSKTFEEQGRKTVFLVITDGVANGYRKAGERAVSADISIPIQNALIRDWSEPNVFEAAQDYKSRADEFAGAATRLKAAAGEDGVVVVGYWEDGPSLQRRTQYYDAYTNPWANSTTAGVRTPNQSVREVFVKALRGLGSQDAAEAGANDPDGLKYYVDTNGDVSPAGQASFVAQIKEAMKAAFKTEDANGTFTVTEGYRVKSVTINGKVVSDVTVDGKAVSQNPDASQITGTVVQTGINVKITVPQSIFNPGKNDFKYDLEKIDGSAAETDEEAEEDAALPADDYAPAKEEAKVGQLTGYFTVGDKNNDGKQDPDEEAFYKTTEIGSQDPTNVSYSKLEYCYPRVEKSVSDENAADDNGVISPDTFLPKRDSYGNRLTTEDETFTYNITYRMYNSPLEWKGNVKLFDQVDSRFEILSARVTNGTGFEASWDDTNMVTVKVPELPGLNETTDTNGDGVITKEGKYGGHKFKVYNLEIKVKLKDENKLANNKEVYTALMKENAGLGAINQGKISFDTINYTTNEEGKVVPVSKTRRSNAVYSNVPYVPDISKNVNQGKDQADGDATIDNTPGDSKNDGTQELTVASEKVDYYYQIRSTWPGLVDQFTLEDTLVEGLEVAENKAYITFNGKRISSLDRYIKVEGNKVSFNFEKPTSALQTRRIVNEIEAAGGNGTIQLNIHARVKEGADLEKYRDSETGKIRIPNDAQITVDITKADNLEPVTKKSNTVYVTLDEGEITKRINEHDSVYNTTEPRETFNFDVYATVPAGIADYTEFYIKDPIDKHLVIDSYEIVSGNKGAFALTLEDESHAKGTQVLYARMKAGQNANLKPNTQVHLVIRAHLSDKATGVIENSAEVFYDGSNVPPTPPVVVTPPPAIDKQVKAVINERTATDGDLLPIDGTVYKANESNYRNADGGVVVYDTKNNTEATLAIWNDPFEYTINSRIPEKSSSFRITDTLDYTLQPYKGNINGVADQRHLYIVEEDGSLTETVTLSDGKVVNLSAIIKTESKTASQDEQSTQPTTIEDKNRHTFVADITDVEKQGVTPAQLTELMEKLSGKNVRMTFYAQFKAGTSVTGYVGANAKDQEIPWVPNVAKLSINNKKDIKSNPVYVRPKINKPEINKTVDGNGDSTFNAKEELNGVGATFTYKVESEIPYNAKSYHVDDTLEKVLHLMGNGTNAISVKWVDTNTDVFTANEKATAISSKFINADGSEVAKETADTRQVLSIDFEGKVAGNQGRKFIITFPVAIKDGADLTPYKTGDADPVIPNKASFTVNNTFTETSKPAEVTPPSPTIEKRVKTSSNQTFDYAGELATAEEKYQYQIDTYLPNDSSLVSFDINDTLDETLTFAEGVASNVKVELIDETGRPTNITTNSNVVETQKGQDLKVSVKQDFIKENLGKHIRVTFGARIKTANEDSAIVEKLKALKTITYTVPNIYGPSEQTTERGAIPNKASYSVPNNPRFTKESNIVPVTPPGEAPTVEKKINGSLEHLDTLNEAPYTYNIKASLPVDITSYKKFVISDEVNGDIAVADATVLGAAAKFFDVKVDGQKVTATMKNIKDAKDLSGKTVELVITSHIKRGVTTAKIPNTATITYQNKSHVDGTPDTTKDTPPVTVTPPPLTKKINDTLETLDIETSKDYTYNIKTVVPGNIAKYKSYVISDTLHEDLEAKSAKIVGEAAQYFDVKVDGQKVTATIKDFKAAAAIAGQEVELVIVSQIRAGVTRQSIPNTAKITFSNTPIVDGEEDPKGETPPKDTPPTPPVTVTPPGQVPTPVKTVDSKESLVLDKMNQVFTYDITVQVPENTSGYTKFELTDDLSDILTITETSFEAGTVTSPEAANENAGLVVAKIPVDKISNFAGKSVTLTIKARIKNGTTQEELAPFLDANGDIPNKATLSVGDKPGQTKDSNVVPVTPPKPNTPPITKKVNGADSAALAKRQEVFTYTIETTVPTGAYAFEVNDTLEDVLEFEGTVIARVNDQIVPAEQVTTTGQELSVKLTREQTIENAGQPVHIEFKAKIKDGADLTPYITDNVTSIPNTASYTINNNPSTKKDSNTVPVTPPTPNEPEIDKKINRTLTDLTIERNMSYMYNINAEIPQDISTYKQFVITDTLDKALAINGEVAVHVDGYATDAVEVSVEGNKVVATVVDFAKLDGFKQIELYIPAFIKQDADLSEYVDNKIPNTASLDFVNSNGIQKRKDTQPVHVTPPTPDTPPTPEPPTPGNPVKTVSRVPGLEQTLLMKLGKATEAFRFDIKSLVPTDQAKDKRIELTSITITDTLDNNLKIDGVAVKFTGTADAAANYIDEDVEDAQKVLDEAQAKLDELKQVNGKVAEAKLMASQATVADLEAQLAEAKVTLEALKVPEYKEVSVETPVTSEAPTTTSSTDAETDTSTKVEETTVPSITTTEIKKELIDKSAEIAAQEAVVAGLMEQLEAAKATVATVTEELAAAKTPAEIKIEVDNQQKVVDKAQAKLDEALAKQKAVNEKLTLFAKVNDKGELTAEAIKALGGTIKVEGQQVTVDFSDENTMEALKGYTVTVIIYSSLKDVNALKNVHFTQGIDNTADVTFNHNNDPKSGLKKKTNTVKVIPPRPELPAPPPVTPPTPNEPPVIPPTPNEPPVTPPSVSVKPSAPSLPATGETTSPILAIVGFVLAGFGLVALKKRDN